MKMNKTFTNLKQSEIVLLLSVAASILWILGQLVNVYHFAVTGAIFEMLWLPLLIMLVGLPVFSLIMFIREKANVRSLYFYSILIVVATVLFTVLVNKE
jgi:hypothetical protein